jgi:hypothetical protein
MNSENTATPTPATAAAALLLPYTVPSGKPFQDLFGPCRSTQMDLIDKGELESFLSGAGPRGRRMIVTASWVAYVERQRQREANGEIGTRSPNPRARAHGAAVPAPAPRPARNRKATPPVKRPRATRRKA